MKVEIDQSGKIEETSKDTIICISNDRWDCIKFEKSDKRYLQLWFRNRGQSRNFVLFTFTSLLAILIKRNTSYRKITIDQEYFGKDHIIRKIILDILPDSKNTIIHFGSIGKSSHAHFRAHEIAVKKTTFFKTVSLKEVMEVLKKTEVVRRLADT